MTILLTVIAVFVVLVGSAVWWLVNAYEKDLEGYD